MKNISRHTGKLDVIKRLPSSRNGNPRYLLRIAGYTCRTAPDAGIAYAITNYDGKTVTALIGSHYGVATLDTIEGCAETPGNWRVAKQ